ncbi:hypothetical protein [Nocardioides sp. NPDC000441]|uniref:hypothetical protein n=1 Tax=Nocardioides sp. NPDC000441 TaxID=3154256 RepID=UPI0033189F30
MSISSPETTPETTTVAERVYQALRSQIGSGSTSRSPPSYAATTSPRRTPS